MYLKVINILQKNWYYDINLSQLIYVVWNQVSVNPRNSLTHFFNQIFCVIILKLCIHWSYELNF